jgi:hypothetical protein
MKHLAFLPMPNIAVNPNAFWKEIRSYKHYVVIGSELARHGIQIFDMTKVRQSKQNRQNNKSCE